MVLQPDVYKRQLLALDLIIFMHLFIFLDDRSSKLDRTLQCRGSCILYTSSQISTGSNTVWFSVLIIGAIIVVVAPFIIYASKKPSWVEMCIRDRNTPGNNQPLYRSYPD